MHKLWAEKHLEVLSQESERQLSLGSLLEPFVEVALWPHLYPGKWFCESQVGAPREWAPFAAGGRRTDGNQHKESGKALFVAKLTCSVGDYAARFDLLQFQLDRHVLRTLLGSSIWRRQPWICCTGTGTGRRSIGDANMPTSRTSRGNSALGPLCGFRPLAGFAPVRASPLCGFGPRSRLCNLIAGRAASLFRVPTTHVLSNCWRNPWIATALKLHCTWAARLPD